MKTLLWIDDDESLIDASTPVFYKYGFFIFKATNTVQALTTLRERQVDGVLLDVKLGNGESGLDLLKEIRALYPHTKIAMFTGYPKSFEHVVSESVGASAYLAKVDKSIPLDPGEQKDFFQALDQVFEDQCLTDAEGTAGHDRRLSISFLQEWWFKSVAAGLLSAVLSVILIPSEYLNWRVPIILFALVTCLMLCRNPRFRYMKIFWAVFAVMCSWNALPTIELVAKRYGKDPAEFLLKHKGLDWPVNIGLVGLLRAKA
jgi:ActR/RegA family two-component response regulator